MASASSTPATVAGTMANRVTLTRLRIGRWLTRPNGSGIAVLSLATRSHGPIDMISSTSPAIAAARAAAEPPQHAPPPPRS